MPQGLKQVYLADVTPVRYTVNNPSYQVDNRPDGFLPIGSFHICYTIIHQRGDIQENLGNECDRADIEPLSPPLLVSPADSEQVEITRPPFSWLPPAPTTLFNQLLYDWKLVEVRSNQTGALAIQQNIPLLSQSGLAGSALAYPASFRELEHGKLYAWQVTAKNNTSIIAKTDVWTFRVKDPAKEISQTGSGSYTRLKKPDEAPFVFCNGTLRYEYLNELNDSLVAVTITDMSTKSRNVIKQQQEMLPVKFGQNFIDADLSEYPGMINKHIYLLELTNSNNEKWCIKFEYRKQD
jgi:hypothetical protein